VAFCSNYITITVALTVTAVGCRLRNRVKFAAD